MTNTINIGGYTLEYIIDSDSISITGYTGGDSRLIIPENIDGKKVITIGKKAFMGANLLKSVTLPGSIASIEDWAFAQCTHLNEVIINGVDTPSQIASRLSIGRGVFDGCNAFSHMCLGYNEPDDLAFLLGAAIEKLPASFLYKSDDIGSPDWFNMWDKSLISFINQRDDEGYTDRVLCGEEDISYDNIGSIDGEMPGESASYIQEIRKGKCYLCLLRLLHNCNLSDANKETFIKYLLDKNETWLVLKDDLGEQVDYYRLYADIGGINNDNIDKMLEDLGSTHAEAKAFLINYRQNNLTNNDFFSDMFL